ncbi:MAG: hypothetical protein FJ134_04875 [Deltaproteobacteria bacterium]|nr:hypothetical protein [Deltaproteobacteria bacterium]
MKPRNAIAAIVLALAVLSLICSCEPPRTYPVAPTYYYVLPTTTYLRDCPSYDCGIIAQVFSGDRMEVIDRNDYGWARGRLDRTGAIGWIPGDLLSLAPLPATYYVAATTIYLRECADYNCRALELLYRGDRVEKIDQDYRGWWRVNSFKSRNVGWIPASAVSPQPGPPFYYVAISSLALRSGPSTANKMVTSLSLNTQVELLGMGPSGWAQVRVVPSGLIGWVSFRYLETFPVPYPKAAPAKRKSPKAAPEKEEAPKTAPKAM